MTYPQGTNARLIEVAAAEVGTVEEGDNLTKYGKFTACHAFTLALFEAFCVTNRSPKHHKDYD